MFFPHCTKGDVVFRSNFAVRMASRRPNPPRNESQVGEPATVSICWSQSVARSVAARFRVIPAVSPSAGWTDYSPEIPRPWVISLRSSHFGTPPRSGHVDLLATYKFALASRRRKLSLAACAWRMFSSANWKAASRSRRTATSCRSVSKPTALS